ncbi:MAG: copper chaperone PCu(A)C [Reyranella sp.]|uniref:copper chaperone PCu(A)C n=1 Tax=Reyranella sp. TaxID=1929291 RepID=UPI001AC3CB90|nr:copper chaperone PCu(A)C [Reyranella sp.]MBN9090646.1 copper chaperone PCu(A)C [Reyranella sp.]
MNIDISRPWIRTSLGEKCHTGGFFTVTNKSDEADRLIAAESPVATKIEIHGIKVVGHGICMRPLEKGLHLPPDTAITLKPRGYHLLIELKAPLAQGQRVPMTLTFETAGAQTVELLVEAPGPVGDEALAER